MMRAIRTYLDMSAPPAAPPPDALPSDVRLQCVWPCPPALYRRLYAEVGAAYYWVDRLAWSDQRIEQHLANRAITMWVLYRGDDPAGYFELRRHLDGSVEIAYFGLVPRCIGFGLGRQLLTAAIRHAWELRPSRVWLHTSSLDHPAAMPNYLRRGFKPYRTESYEVVGGEQNAEGGMRNAEVKG